MNLNNNKDFHDKNFVCWAKDKIFYWEGRFWTKEKQAPFLCWLKFAKKSKSAKPMFIWHMGLLPILYALSVSLFLSLGSVHTLGAVLGCLISIPTMALLGRRGAALYVMTLAYLLGYLLIGCAQNVEMIVIGGYTVVQEIFSLV